MEVRSQLQARLLYPQEKNLWYPLTGWAPETVDLLETRLISCTCWESNPGSSVVTILTMLCQLKYKYKTTCWIMIYHFLKNEGSSWKFQQSPVIICKHTVSPMIMIMVSKFVIVHTILCTVVCKYLTSFSESNCCLLMYRLRVESDFWHCFLNLYQLSTWTAHWWQINSGKPSPATTWNVILCQKVVKIHAKSSYLMY
jgi:hypothetical protein